MSTDKPTPEACETCGLTAWINNGDCDDLCAFCKMRDERDEYARQLAEVTRERDAMDETDDLAKLVVENAQLRADLAALREDSVRLDWWLTHGGKFVIRPQIDDAMEGRR